MAIWAAALPQRLTAVQQNTVPATPRRYMPGAPEIYFHKVIDNSRLVRSADPVRKREMRMFCGTLAVCFLMMMVYVWQHYRAIEYGYQIEEIRSTRDAIADSNRTLKLEEASLKDPGRIDVLAHQMGMQLPAVGQVERTDSITPADTGAPVMARVNNDSAGSVPY